METVEVNTMELDGKEFFEVDVLVKGENKYDYFVEINDPKNVKIFKLVSIDDEEHLIDVDGVELVEAFRLFNIKYN